MLRDAAAASPKDEDRTLNLACLMIGLASQAVISAELMILVWEYCPFTLASTVTLSCA